MANKLEALRVDLRERYFAALRQVADSDGNVTLDTCQWIAENVAMCYAQEHGGGAEAQALIVQAFQEFYLPSGGGLPS